MLTTPRSESLRVGRRAVRRGCVIFFFLLRRWRGRATRGVRGPGLPRIRLLVVKTWDASSFGRDVGTQDVRDPVAVTVQHHADDLHVRALELLARPDEVFAFGCLGLG